MFPKLETWFCQHSELIPPSSESHARKSFRYNPQEWFSLEKLLDKNEERNQIGKHVNEESVSHSNHGLEANPTTDSSLKPSRGECSPASRSPRAGFPDPSLSRHPWCPKWENPSANTVEASNGQRCYNSQPGEHRRSDFSPGDGAHGKEEVSEPPP